MVLELHNYYSMVHRLSHRFDVVVRDNETLKTRLTRLGIAIQQINTFFSDGINCQEIKKMQQKQKNAFYKTDSMVHIGKEQMWVFTEIIAPFFGYN